MNNFIMVNQFIMRKDLIQLIRYEITSNTLYITYKMEDENISLLEISGVNYNEYSKILNLINL